VFNRALKSNGVLKLKSISLIFLAALLAAQSSQARLEASAADSVQSGLTIERMYRDPRITGVSPRRAAWSSNGEELAFIWNREGERFYDIFIYSVRDRKLRKATDAAAIAESGKSVMTKAEIDRLSTLRRSGGGIFSYAWSPEGGRILFPLKGDLYILETGSGDVRRLFKTKASETDPAFAPGGGRVSFIRDNDIWMLDTETGTTVQLTDSGTETLYNGMGDYVDYEEVGIDRAYWWSPDGSRIAYFQTDVSPITELLVPDYRGRFVEVRRQARPVAGGNNGLKRLGVLNIETGKTVWVDPGERIEQYITQVHWHPGGRKLLVLSEPRSLKELHFISADCETGQTDTLFTVRDDKWVNIHNTFVRWSEKGDFFYFTSEQSGWNHIYTCHWKTGKIEQLTSGPWQVTALNLVEEGGDIWYTSTETGPAERHLFRLEKGGEKFRVTPLKGWYSARLTENARHAAVVYSNPSNPPDLYLLKSLRGEEYAGSAGGKMEDEPEGVKVISPAGRWPLPEGLDRITRSPAEDFEKLQLPVPVYLTMPSVYDGKRIHALVLLPPELEGAGIEESLRGEGSFPGLVRHPAVICVHGGGYSQSVTMGWRWRTLYDSYLVNNKGYVLLDLDYRGSSGYGRDWRTDVHLDIGGSDLEDEMTGLQLLRKLPFVIEDRIGMWGWSYGGYMTTLALLKYPDAFMAGAAVAPVNDWRNYDTHYTEERLGMPDENREAYEKGSPVTYAENLKNHLLVIHGMLDDNVHFQDTVQLVDAMIGSGTDFEVMFYPGARHGIRADQSRIHLFRKITRHFERYLRGIPDADCP